MWRFKKRRRCFRHSITTNSHVMCGLAMTRWMIRITVIGLGWRLSVAPATTLGTRIYNHTKTKTRQGPKLSSCAQKTYMEWIFRYCIKLRVVNMGRALGAGRPKKSLRRSPCEPSVKRNRTLGNTSKYMSLSPRGSHAEWGPPCVTFSLATVLFACSA